MTAQRIVTAAKKRPARSVSRPVGIVKKSFVQPALKKDSAMLAKKRKKNERRPSARPNSPRTSSTTTPTLRFTPWAWAKLLFWRDLGTTEIGAFGISAAADPLFIEDVRLVRQTCSAVTVRFDDGAVADFFDEQVDLGLPPERFSRVWLHTHPGSCPQPSAVDEATFARVFGSFHWSVMFILARGGASYARLQYRIGPGGAWEIPVAIEYAEEFPATDHATWRRDYQSVVEAEPEWSFDDVVDFRRPPEDWPFDAQDWEDFLRWGCWFSIASTGRAAWCRRTVCKAPGRR